MNELGRQTGSMRRHRPRAVPVLLLKGGLLYKTVKFKNAKYVGDPRIAVKIFNDKGADELILLDITATCEERRPDFKLIEEIAGECFMPLAYGGGIRSIEDAQTILKIGVEKIVINTCAAENPAFITEAARINGSSSVVVCIDAKRDAFGRYRVHTRSGTQRTSLDPVSFARQMEAAGAGEIIINSVDRDGTGEGYDLTLTRNVAAAVTIPVVACGGAGKVEHLGTAVRETGASAAAAGSLFVFQGPHRAVLITFPDDEELKALFA